MKRHPYIQTLFLCGMLLNSCTQHELYPDDTNANHTISFQTGEVLTRGFIGNDELGTTGSKLHIYGYHDKNFLVQVSLNGNVVGSGEGKSKKRAEQDAARDALQQLFPEEKYYSPDGRESPFRRVFFLQ